MSLGKGQGPLPLPQRLHGRNDTVTGVVQLDGATDLLLLAD
jgi:hypothetical protein